MNRIFNEVRMAYQGQPLTCSEVKLLLSELPYSKTDLFLTALVATGCIERPEKGKYIFTSHPIHHSLIERAIAYVKDKQNAYAKKYSDKKKEHISQPENKSDIQKAIDLLLSTGEYEIYRVEKVVTVKKTQL
jgi:hypothetical protein